MFELLPARSALAIFIGVCAVVPAQSQEKEATFATFEAPGAGTGSGQGTRTQTINPAGEIAGWYSDANNVIHGFVRDPDGSFNTFEAPGASTGAYQGTYASDINPKGETTGSYYDASNVGHSFLRAYDGIFVIFNAPRAGKGAFQGTFATNINAEGAVAGSYFDGKGTLHGFVRAPDGCISSFDPRGSTSTFTGGADGGSPGAGVIRDADGNLYGTTLFGGINFDGVVFKLDLKGNETVLYSFTGGAGGSNPYGPLIFDEQGNLDGVAETGGRVSGVCFAGCGVIFEVTLEDSIGK